MALRRAWWLASLAAATGACDEPNDWPAAPGRRPVGAAPTEISAPTGCPDPLVGLWTARRYDGVKWYEHRISFDRRAGTVYCHQESRSWPGLAGDTAPPRCPAGGFAFHQVLLTCELVSELPQLEVRSVAIDVQRHTCADEFPGYNLDHFTGTLDGNTWTTVNNDGGDDVDKPYRFHRLRCRP